MPRPFRTRLLAAAAAASLAACTDDPFERPGTVAPRGFNDANLRAMVVDPAHLRRGVEATTTRGDALKNPTVAVRILHYREARVAEERPESIVRPPPATKKP